MKKKILINLLEEIKILYEIIPKIQMEDLMLSHNKIKKRISELPNDYNLVIIEVLENFIKQYEEKREKQIYININELIDQLMSRNMEVEAIKYATYFLNNNYYYDKEKWIFILDSYECFEPIYLYFISNIDSYPDVIDNKYVLEKILISIGNSEFDIGDKILPFLKYGADIVKNATLQYLEVKKLTNYQENIIELFREKSDYYLLDYAKTLCELGITEKIKKEFKIKIQELKKDASINIEIVNKISEELKEYINRYSRASVRVSSKRSLR